MPTNSEKTALLKPSKKVGVKGILPLGCFPLWGREGVTLRALDERKRMTEKQGFNRAEKTIKLIMRSLFCRFILCNSLTTGNKRGLESLCEKFHSRLLFSVMAEI
jgi:hypothetical protein